jgi:hypothetical protein
MDAFAKEDVAIEIAWNGGAIGHCPLHGGTWKGTGDVDASLDFWRERSESDYDGVFSSETDAKKHVEYAILAASGKTECAQCTDNQYTIPVDPQ